MNNLTNHQDDLYDEDAQTLREDLDSLYRIPVPAMHFDPTSHAVRRLDPVTRHWRPAFVAAAAVAGLALFVGGPAFTGGTTDRVSAEEVVERTQAVAATNSPAEASVSYHMVARNEMYGPPGVENAAINSTVETWYQDADHQRSETYDESGRLIFGQTQNEDHLWMYSDAAGLDGAGDGEVRVVHTNPDGMAFGVVGAHDFGANSLSGLLEQYSSRCSQAESLGEETVAGRPAYVIEVTQTPETCDIKPIVTQDGDMTNVKVESHGGAAAGVIGVAAGSVNVISGQGEGAAAGEPAEAPVATFEVLATTTKIWVDQETFITLKMETTTEDGPLALYEVTEFEVNPDFDPSVFIYEAPEGVEVVEAEGPQDIKIVLSGGIGFTAGEFTPAEAAPIEEGTTP